MRSAPIGTSSTSRELLIAATFRVRDDDDNHDGYGDFVINKLRRGLINYERGRRGEERKGKREREREREKEREKERQTDREEERGGSDSNGQFSWHRATRN